MNRPLVKTRGGLLVVLVVLAALGFELRTVVGMLFGVSVPMGPYVLALLLVLAAIGVVAELSRTTVSDKQGQ
jgi:amino acid transporter